MNENRRDFFKTAGAGLGAAAGAILIPGAAEAAVVPQWTEKDKLLRIAGCSWPIRSIFKTRGGGGRGGGGAGRGDAPPASAPPAAAGAAPAAGATAPAGGRGG